jgi:SAM-dependent methyltransferase
MSGSQPEFDEFSKNYQDLLKDPMRDRFAPGGAEFFHLRKRDIIREYFRRTSRDTRQMAYLDLGCGQGELVSLMQDDFSYVAACDPSPGMMTAGGLESKGIDARVQHDMGKIPFESGTFDFVTAVCVFHHVPIAARAALVEEMCRVIKPTGTLAIIEHNPFNPVTRLIVSRTPVDADAILLRPSETRGLFESARLRVDDQSYFLYFPESVYGSLRSVEALLARVPLGGQYAVFANAG